MSPKAALWQCLLSGRHQKEMEGQEKRDASPAAGSETNGVNVTKSPPLHTNFKFGQRVPTNAEDVHVVGVLQVSLTTRGPTCAMGKMVLSPWASLERFSPRSLRVSSQRTLGDLMLGLMEQILSLVHFL